jgi:hypothetical protein
VLWTVFWKPAESVDLFTFWPGGFAGSYFYRSYDLTSVKHHKVKIFKRYRVCFFKTQTDRFYLLFRGPRPPIKKILDPPLKFKTIQILPETVLIFFSQTCRITCTSLIFTNQGLLICDLALTLDSSRHSNLGFKSAHMIGI